MPATGRNPTSGTTRSTGSSRTRSKPAPGFVVVGNPGCRRVALFQAALQARGLPPATVLAYADLLAGRDPLERVVRPGTVVRIESPGRDFDVEKALLAAGADVADADGPSRIRREDALRLSFDK